MKRGQRTQRTKRNKKGKRESIRFVEDIQEGLAFIETQKADKGEDKQ